MFKKTLLLLIVVIQTTNISAQKATASWSKQFLFEDKKDGRPTKVIGSDNSTTYILFEDNRRKVKNHLSISSFNKKDMKLIKKVNLFKLFPEVKSYDFQLAKFGNGKIYVSWINDAKTVREVFVAVLNGDFTIASKLKKLKSAKLNTSNTNVKVASFEILINPDVKEAPVCIILEKNAGLKDSHQSIATQFNDKLKELNSIPLKIDLNFSSDKSLLTGQNKIYKNAFEYIYTKHGVYGYLDTYEISFSGLGLPFIHYDFNTKRSSSKIITTGHASTGDLVITEKGDGVIIYLLNTVSHFSTSALMSILLENGLSIKVQENNPFTSSLLKTAYPDYEYLTSKKGMRKLGSSKPLIEPKLLHPYTSIENIITTEQGDYISLSYNYFKRDANGRTIKNLKKGLLIAKISPDGKVEWLKNFKRFYENKAGREGSSAGDSRLLFQNDQLICAYFTDIRTDGEKLDKSLVNNSFNILFIDPSNGKLIKSNSIMVNNETRKGTFVAKGIGLKKDKNNIYFFGQPKAKDLAGEKVYGNKKGSIAIVKIQ